MEYLKNNEIENTAAYVAWLLATTKGYGVKLVNPGGTAAWAWGLNCLSINDPVPYYDITPAEIISGLIKTNEYLGLPHSIHIHQNSLGLPGNYTVTLDTLKLAEGVKTKNKFGRESVMHSTHIQFHSYGGDSWANFESKAKEVMDYVNSQKNITVDLGCVTLDETTTMTADGPFEHHLNHLNHLKWANVDVELETAAGVVPYVYDKNIKVCGIQWAIGLELGLYAKDPMRTFVTTDHPNAGPFIRYPRVIKWLMSQKAREATLDTFKYKDKVIDATNIHGMDRELTLYEIAQMTRTGPAKALGLSHMYGGLGAGLDANVGVFDLNVKNMPSDPDMIEKALLRASWFIKSGQIVVKDGEIIDHGNKRTIWVKAKVKENPQVTRDIHEKFLKNYTCITELPCLGLSCAKPAGHQCRCGGLNMAKITLKPFKTPELYLECPTISPDAFAGKTPADIAEMEARGQDAYQTRRLLQCLTRLCRENRCRHRNSHRRRLLPGEVSRVEDDRRIHHHQWQRRHVRRRMDERRKDPR